MKKFPFFLLAASLLLPGALSSCSGDDPVGDQTGETGGDQTEGTGGSGSTADSAYVLVATTSDVNVLVKSNSLDSGSVTTVNNGLEVSSGTAWVYWNNKYLYRLQTTREMPA